MPVPDRSASARTLWRARPSLLRFDGDGQLIWTAETGGDTDGGSVARDVCVLEDGSFYIVGSFEETATLCQGDPNETTLEAVSAGTPSP